MGVGLICGAKKYFTTTALINLEQWIYITLSVLLCRGSVEIP